MQDHDYCKETDKRKTNIRSRSKNSKKYEEESHLLHSFINNFKQNDDYMTNNEFSDLMSQLPLRSRQQLVQCLFSHDGMKCCIENAVIKQITNDCEFLKNRKHGHVSVLMSKDYEDLKNFKWIDVVHELKSSCPFLLKVLLAVLVPDSLSDEQKVDRTAGHIPRIGMIYSMLAQGRNTMLSKVQRIISTVLFDNICDQKVIYDSFVLM